MKYKVVLQYIFLGYESKHCHIVCSIGISPVLSDSFTELTTSLVLVYYLGLSTEEVLQSYQLIVKVCCNSVVVGHRPLSSVALA